MSSRVSPDGMYYWSGERCVTTLSPDGRHRWDGNTWVPVPGGSNLYYQPPTPRREPTSWTRPLQYAVIAWYALSALSTVGSRYLMSGVMGQVVNRTIQQQEQTYPSPPSGYADSMTAFMNAMIWFGVLFGLAIAAVAIIGAVKRWTWVYYVVLVLLGLGALSLPISVFNVVSGGGLNRLQGLTMPAWSYWESIAAGMIAAILFAWMLYAAVKLGPWGMRRVS